MSRYTGKDIKDIVKEYTDQQKTVLDIAVEIKPHENVVDPMLLLGTINSERSAEDMIPLAQAALGGTTVIFYYGDAVLGEYALPVNPNFGLIFTGKPYLLQILFNAVYGIMLGKLKVPSNVLKTQEGTPEPAEESEKTAKKK
jgi:hypothetical protein